MRLFKSHIDAYYRHQKILRDLRFLCELNCAPFKPGSIIMKFYFVSDFCPHCGMYFINDEDCAYHDCVFSDFS